MHIEELSSKTGMGGATIRLNYGDVRDISNALYNLSKDNPEYLPLYNDWKIVFDLVKHGKIQPETIKKLTVDTEEPAKGITIKAD